jgi:hypothetical protein
VKCYNNCDICVLRNGKGRKNDPPIPDDLPPLPKPQEKPQEQETITMFDESVLAVPTEQPKAEAPKNDQRKRRPEKKNNRRPDNRRRTQEGGKPQEAQRTQKSQKAQESQKPQEGGENRKPRKRYYRGKKKPQGGNSQ